LIKIETGNIKKPYKYTEESLNLIDFNQNELILNEKALEFLCSIEEDIIIVSIVGRARTGKSLLMNLLLDNLDKSKGVIIVFNN